MDCKTARSLHSEAVHNRLSPEEAERRQSHLRACEECQRMERAEDSLTEVLERRLPSYPAPSDLKSSLAAKWLPPSVGSKRIYGLRSALPIAATVCLALAFVAGLSLGKRQRADGRTISIEAVNDHLRMLEGETPLQVMASDLHQVKPWFAGKLDFAPPVAFKGDNDFILVGGQVTRFLEQRAACFVFARRLHKISLLVVPLHALPAQDLSALALGATPRVEGASRGFHVVAWGSGEFAYLLVSDLNAPEMLELAKRIEAS